MPDKYDAGLHKHPTQLVIATCVSCVLTSLQFNFMIAEREQPSGTRLLLTQLGKVFGRFSQPNAPIAMQNQISVACFPSFWCIFPLIPGLSASVTPSPLSELTGNISHAGITSHMHVMLLDTSQVRLGPWQSARAHAQDIFNLAKIVAANIIVSILLHYGHTFREASR